MKVKIELENNEHIHEVEEVLEKALSAKKDCSGNEKYSDPFLNELHDYVCEQHSKLVESILDDVKKEIKHNAHGKGSL